MPNLSRNFIVKTTYGAMATAVFASIYVAGTYISRALSTEEPRGPRLTRSMSIAILHGGHIALQRLLECHELRVDTSAADVALCDLKTRLLQEHPDYQKLQSVIAKLEMGGKEDEAVDILKKAIMKANNEGKILEAYENEMLLVEMLIYKGDFEEALQRNCLSSNVEVSDARRPLYKAIIYIMLKEKVDKKQEIIKYWEEFNNLKEAFSCGSCKKKRVEEFKVYTLSKNFNDFEKVVETLKNDILQARKKKKKK